MEGEKDNTLPLNAADLISALYLKYHDNLEKYARRIGYTKEEAEDLVQDIADNSSYTATWQTDNYTVYIMGEITLDEMKRIIDSVSEVKK